MKIHHNSFSPQKQYSFYEEYTCSNLLGSSIHFYNFHTKEDLKLEVDYEDSFCKLVLCMNGYSETFQKERHLYSFRAGRALFYKTSAESYFSLLEKDALFKVIHLHFSKHLMEEINQLNSELFKNEIIELPISMTHLELFRNFNQINEVNQSLAGLLLERTLLDQLCSFSDTFLQLNSYKLKNRQKDMEKIHEAKLILDRSEKYITIEQLAKLVGINTFKIKNMFKEEFQKSIFEYQVDHQMGKARQLLLDTDKSLLDIAMICGYQSIGSFSNAFKRKFGIRPSSIRKY